LKKILVIQEHEEIIKEIDSLLPKDEFEIYYSHNLQDGMEISLRYLPDLIIFYMNNHSESVEVLSKLTGEEKTSSIPLVIISQKNSFEQMRIVMELGADDYLPLQLIEKSLLTSINKRLDKLSMLKARINNQINSFEEETAKPKIDDHILVKIGNKLKLVKFAEIVCITALKEYSKITTKENCKIVVRKSLKNWVTVLPSKSFLRIHRATIINIDFIEKIVKTNERTYTVHLKNISETFDFSQRYTNIMRRTFPS
jgi:DNA-binding LytR/AlgR family response regulator